MEFTDYLSIFNTIVTVILAVTPIVPFIAICKGTEKYTVVPETLLIFSVLNNLGWGCYWYIQGNATPMTCSIICGSMALIFGVIYLFYMAEKKIGKFLLFVFLEFAVTAILSYPFLKIPPQIVGKILIVINVIMYVAPAQNILRVIKEKNPKLIPIVSTIAGAVCSGGWFLFGFLIKDINCMIPNILGCISSIITALIWGYYSCIYKKEEEEDEEERLSADA